MGPMNTNMTSMTTNPSLFSVAPLQTSYASQNTHSSILAKMDDVGRIWRSNDRERRTNKSLKRKGLSCINNY